MLFVMAYSRNLHSPHFDIDKMIQFDFSLEIGCIFYRLGANFILGEFLKTG